MSTDQTVRESVLAVAERNGISLAPDGMGGLTIEGPASTLTPELMAWFKENKMQLIEILADESDDPAPEPWPPTDTFDLPPCPSCGGIDQWQSMAGRWRCMKCDPPTTTRRIEKLAERILRRANH